MGNQPPLACRGVWSPGRLTHAASAYRAPGREVILGNSVCHLLKSFGGICFVAQSDEILRQFPSPVLARRYLGVQVTAEHGDAELKRLLYRRVGVVCDR